MVWKHHVRSQEGLELKGANLDRLQTMWEAEVKDGRQHPDANILLRWIQALHKDASEALSRELVLKLVKQYWSYTDAGITVQVTSQPRQGVVPLLVATRAATEGTPQRLFPELSNLQSHVHSRSCTSLHFRRVCGVVQQLEGSCPESVQGGHNASRRALQLPLLQGRQAHL